MLPVAINTETHLELVIRKPIHRLYRAVAFGTIETREKNVRLVPELNVIPHDEQPLPWDGLARFIVTVLFLNPRVVPDDVVVTVEALPHRRDPGPRGDQGDDGFGGHSDTPSILSIEPLGLTARASWNPRSDAARPTYVADLEGRIRRADFERVRPIECREGHTDFVHPPIDRYASGHQPLPVLDFEHEQSRGGREGLEDVHDAGVVPSLMPQFDQHSRCTGMVREDLDRVQQVLFGFRLLIKGKCRSSEREVVAHVAGIKGDRATVRGERA